MADFNIPENPIFEEEVRQLETADRAHASIFNNILAKLFHNNVFNRKKQQEHETNKQNPHGVTPTQIGAATKSALDMAYQNGNAYTDAKIAELINGAPNTMDTLKEISDAMLANKTVVDAIESSIGSKAPKAEFDTHVANKTLHITAAERTKWNTVDNALSGTSTNSIQNKVVKTAFDQQNTKNSGFESSIASINSNLVPAPDYNSKISISASGFTATNNGWLTVSLKSNGSSAYCKVNNNYACGGSIAVATSYPVVFCNTIPVSRNDVISFEIGTNASFVSAFFISK